MSDIDQLPDSCASAVGPALQRLRAVRAIARGRLDLDHLTTELLDEIRDLFGVDAATLLLAAPAGVRVAASCGLADQVGMEIPMAGELLTGLAAATEPISTVELGGDLYGAGLQARGISSLLGAPLSVGDTFLGLIFVATVDKRPFDDDEVAQFALIADLVALAIENVRRLQGEQQARIEAEEERLKLAFLADASRLLFRSLDLETTLDALARLAVPYLADWCAIDVAEPDGTIRRAATASADVATDPRRDDTPRGMHTPEGVHDVIRSGQSVRFEQVDDAVLGRRATDAAAADAAGAAAAGAAGAVRVGSAVIVPLQARERTLGTITLARFAMTRSYTDDDVSLAEDLGQRAGLAVANARLFDAIRIAEERQRQLAQTLQTSLLPPHLPKLPGVEVAAVYHPAGGGAEVGGDFYDVFHTRGTGWGLVMGDVRGKGPEAAVVTALARYTVRTAAVTVRGTRRLLEVLNEALLAEAEGATEEVFCTATYAGFTRLGDGGLRVEACCGGHPAPLVLRADGTVEPLGRPGLALGMFERPHLAEERTILAPGDMLVAYTDGVTEARRVDPAGGLDLYGDDRLQDLVAASAGLDAATVAGRIESAAVDFSDGQPHDDIAVVVVRNL